MHKQGVASGLFALTGLAIGGALGGGSAELRRMLDDSSSGQYSVVTVPAAAASNTRRKYRVKRDFDQIDRGDYRDQAFRVMRNYFESAVAEIDGIEGLRGRFISVSPMSFGCMAVNSGRDRGVAHITVHSQRGGVGFGDIYYSFSEHAPANTANGGFSIEADEYDLYLQANMFAHSDDKERLTPESAAGTLWGMFLEQAGISHE